MPSVNAKRVAPCIYYNADKIVHPYHLIVSRNKRTFSRVYATLEEAVKKRDEFIAQNTSSQLDCEKTADALYT